MIAPFYKDAQTAIYRGSCWDVMPMLDIASFDLCLTDPPYNLMSVCGDVGVVSICDDEVRHRDIGAWDRDFEPRRLLVEAERLLKPRGGFLAFTSDLLISDYINGPMKHMRTLVWEKTNTTPQLNKTYKPNAEYCIWKGKYGAPTFNGARDLSVVYRGPTVHNADRVYFCEKPLWLIKKLILRHSNVGDVILDPFMGSGTTLRAAKETGRRAIGIEELPEVCDMAVKRLRQDVFEFTDSVDNMGKEL